MFKKLAIIMQYNFKVVQCIMIRSEKQLLHAHLTYPVVYTMWRNILNMNVN